MVGIISEWRINKWNSSNKSISYQYTKYETTKDKIEEELELTFELFTTAPKLSQIIKYIKS